MLMMTCFEAQKEGVWFLWYYSVFLNLPIWANFVDPTDLSLTYYLLPLDQTSSIEWTQPQPQPQPGLATQHWLGLR